MKHNPYASGLWSLYGDEPAPLPLFIVLADGTRLSAEAAVEAAELAGYRPAGDPPNHDPQTEVLDWSGSAWAVRAKNPAELRTAVQAALVEHDRGFQPGWFADLILGREPSEACIAWVRGRVDLAQAVTDLGEEQ